MFDPGFWTFAAVVVALITPWIVYWISNRPRKSKLVFLDTKVTDQDSEPESEGRKLKNVGRLIIINRGKCQAKLVEAYLERIVWDGKERENFFPMPLWWAHGQLNKYGPHVRDIHPNQTVYLDILNNIQDPEYVGERSIVFAVAAGLGIDDFSKLNIGESEVYIRLYQESGQVDEVCIKTNWNGKDVPSIKILRK